MATVIDLISSSPPNPARLVGKPTGPTATAGKPGREPSTTDALADEFMFFSDDFDDTINLDEPILAAASNKRRLWPQHERGRPPKRPSPAPQAQPSARARSVADPIDLTSSPTREDSIPPEPSQDCGPSKSMPLVPFDSDPFASSPLPQPSLPEPTKPASRKPQPAPKYKPFEPESDPFASSPRPKPANPAVIPQSSEPLSNSRSKSQAKPPELKPGLFVTSSAPANVAIGLSSDPFASSPRPVATVPKPARPVYLGESTVPSGRPRRNNDWDPISSSAPESRSFDSPPRKNPVVIDIEDSDAENSDEFPDIANFDVAKQRRSLQRSQSEVIPKPRASKTTKTKTAVDRTREREASTAAAKELDKEVKRREKQQAKEAKTREKERAAAMAEVNKLRTDKKVSTPEMMVDMPSSLNPMIKTQLETMLEGLDVQFTVWESPVENVVKWRRKVRSRFNNDLGLWEPVPLRIEDEKHVLVVMAADEFVKLALEDTLEAHVAKMVQHFSNHQIIYLLEGLVPWMRKNRNLRNRQFTSNVRAETSQTRRRPNATQEYVPEETVEDALLQLQVMHDMLIHHTTIPMETSQWISTFTQHISTVPYRKQRDQATLGAGFCMESGQVKTGEDAKETYVQMLQEIVRVTQPIAYGIASEFGNVSELVRALETEGPNRLEGVRKHANKDGAYSDRTVGQAVSRRIHKVFTGRDEMSTDV